jgi:hypothetical protein
MAIASLYIFKFLTPSESALLVALNLVMVVATIYLGYFAAKIFIYMRFGRLERGWKMVTGGAVSLCIAFLFLTFQHLFPVRSDLYFYLDAVGMTFSISGIFLMVMGLRSHYFVWTRKISNKTAQRPILVKEREDLEE